MQFKVYTNSAWIFTLVLLYLKFFQIRLKRFKQLKNKKFNDGTM